MVNCDFIVFVIIKWKNCWFLMRLVFECDDCSRWVLR